MGFFDFLRRKSSPPPQPVTDADQSKGTGPFSWPGSSDFPMVYEVYQHFLVARPHTFGVVPATVSAAIDAMSAAGFIAERSLVSVARVVRVSQRLVTFKRSDRAGKHTSWRVPLPTRERTGEVTLGRVADLADVVAGWDEYDVLITSDVPPARQPIEIVAYGKNGWAPFPARTRLSISVRAVTVRLSRLDSADDVVRPLPADGSTAPAPVFDEDCPAGIAPGFFLHPHLGPVEIPAASVGRFWLTFDPGKFLYPPPGLSSVDICDPELVGLLSRACGCTFAQACDAI